MTGYTVHTGSTDKFSNGWDQIFAGKKTASKTAKKSGTQSAKKTPPAKAAVKSSKKKT